MSARRNAMRSKPNGQGAKRNRRITFKRDNGRSLAGTRIKHGRLGRLVAERPQIAVPLPTCESGLRDDPRLDRRIIEGMLRDRRDLLDQLAREGLRPSQIIRRAADLGLSEAYIRQVQGVAADLAGERPGARRNPTTLGARTCLCCDRVFLSSGPGNRLCMRCRGGDAGLAQL
jgi:hypothetical protein